jgi:hypothetical protein
MCLSPEVDAVAGVTIAVFAVDTLRHNKNLHSLPLALVPTIFALHTFSSALVWWAHRGQVPQSVGSAATTFYIAVAFAILPSYVPFAVWSIEPLGARRNALGVLTLAGVFVSFSFAQGIAQGHSSMEVGHHFVAFHVEQVSIVAVMLYFVATCGSMLISGFTSLVTWGVLNVVVVLGLAWWMSEDLPSLWCFWAAATSGFVAWFMRSDSTTAIDVGWMRRVAVSISSKSR